MAKVSDPLQAFIRMLILSSAMSISSFVCGLIPLSFQLSPYVLRIISMLSMGLLSSTALVLIIPEGIENMYASYADDDQLGAKIGMLLLGGFMLMYIVDNLHILGKAVASSTEKYTGIEWDFEQLDPTAPIQTIPSTENDSRVKKFYLHVKKLFATLVSSPLTLGLVIHSITDGMVLTSSIFVEKETLNLIIFVAIFIHKLPTSFSLVSILIAEGYPKSAVKLHLFMFSSSLMLGSILSFIIIQLISEDISSVGKHISAALMLSGGTFLYIGFHTMMEMMSPPSALTDRARQPPRSSGSSASNDSTTTIVTKSNDEMTILEFGITILGFILPLFVLLINE